MKLSVYYSNPAGPFYLCNYEDVLHTYKKVEDANAALDLLASEQTVLADRFPKFFRALYPEEGGPCLGFSCGQCGDVTRTQRGIRSHLWKKHKLRQQIELNLKSGGQNV